MTLAKAGLTRRHVLAGAALALRPRDALAQPASPIGKPAMPPQIRAATPQDVPAIAELLLEDARQRAALDSVLWSVAADARARLNKAIGAAFDASRAALPPEFWLVAEHAGRMLGIAHAVIVPVPPIYNGEAGSPGLLLDDCFISADAPSGTSDQLLAATEAALKTAGAARLIASCPAAGPLRPLYERKGYEPVTLYMAKHRLRSSARTSAARPATAADIPGIVERSAEHRRTLASINPRFWHIHPEADHRFEAWMRRSLTLKDRDMLVAADVDRIRGYVIAQPISPLLVPAAHDAAAIGVIDDFYDEDFANVSTFSHGGRSGEGLLAAAETAFARRRVDSALVVCPAGWTSKIALLEGMNYRTAKLWMLKR
jgi:hypothetical protein